MIMPLNLPSEAHTTGMRMTLMGSPAPGIIDASQNHFTAEIQRLPLTMEKFPGRHMR